MPQPTPELQKAAAELKKAQAAASTASLQQWDIYGLPWKARINLMLGSGGLVVLLAFISNILWSQYQIQLKWATLLQKRPQLSSLHGPSPTLSIVVSLFFAYRFYLLAKRLCLVYRGTQRFSELRKETMLFMVLGIVIALLLTGAYLFWRTT